MNGRAGLAWFVAGLVILGALSANAQVLMQPTPAPTLTAENERWYLSGQAITYAGNLYFPAGAEVFFNPNEMVRSGSFNGIPLYARTTIEPYSVVYVPLAGGRMQPYERPRSGELAGTSGSMPSSLPANPESSIGVAYPYDDAVAVPTTGVRSMPATPERSRPVTAKPRKAGVLFIEFENVRWYPTGQPKEVDRSRLAVAGRYGGFDVWRDPAHPDIIYMAPTIGSSVLVPYTRQRSGER